MRPWFITHCSSNIYAFADAIDINMIVMSSSTVVRRSVNPHCILTTSVMTTKVMHGPRCSIVSMKRYNRRLIGLLIQSAKER